MSCLDDENSYLHICVVRIAPSKVDSMVRIYSMFISIFFFDYV
jgi:hypothetical protein